jgi:hypothetical protein
MTGKAKILTQAEIQLLFIQGFQEERDLRFAIA